MRHINYAMLALASLAATASAFDENYQAHLEDGDRKANKRDRKARMAAAQRKAFKGEK